MWPCEARNGVELDSYSPRLLLVAVKLLKVMENQDPTPSSSGSFFLLASPLPSSNVVRKRGLLPLLSPPLVVLDLLISPWCLAAGVASNPPLLLLPLAWMWESVEREREREREWEWEWAEWVLLVLCVVLVKVWTGVVTCGAKWGPLMTPHISAWLILTDRPSLWLDAPSLHECLTALSMIKF